MPGEQTGFDIGPETADRYAAEIGAAATVFWSGAMGRAELVAFDGGTRTIAEAFASTSATTVVGGRDTVQAMRTYGLQDRVSHLSTGGRATLQLLAGRDLHGLRALRGVVSQPAGRPRPRPGPATVLRKPLAGERADHANRVMPAHRAQPHACTQSDGHRGGTQSDGFGGVFEVYSALARDAGSRRCSGGGLQAIAVVLEATQACREWRRRRTGHLRVRVLRGPADRRLGPTLKLLRRGDVWWLALGVVLEAVSLLGEVVLFRGVFGRSGNRVGWRASSQITMAGTAATKVIATAGGGGIALSVWALAGFGLSGTEVANGMVCFEILMYGVYMGAIAIAGFGLWFGLFAGRAPAGVTLVPAVLAVVVIVIVVSMLFVD